jgi:hypothetical protein
VENAARVSFHKSRRAQRALTARRVMAARADRGRGLARPNGNLDAVAVGSETGVVIDKFLEAMAAV